MAQFTVLAQHYDELNRGADFKATADFIESVFKLYGIAPSLVLDAACGTGNLTIELDKRGYDMIGLDISDAMLSVALGKKRRGNILFIKQDMRNFELYGTVDAIICAYDSINYLETLADVGLFFKNAANYLNPGGILIFDINSRYKFEYILGNNCFTLEGQDVFCSWQSRYSKRKKICRHDLTIFAQTDEGLYRRFDETQYEYYHAPEELIAMLKDTGFTDVRVFFDNDTNLEHISGKIGSSGESKRQRVCIAAKLHS